MSGQKVNCLRLSGVLFTVLQVGLAQTCYYPNGVKAADSEKPCSSQPGSACCPDKWECMDNGLCHYPPDKLFGRYSCTDQKWESPGCAKNMCTYNMTAPGGESITQCADHDNAWCCNADAQHVNCCKESPAPRPFFKLQDGKAYATIGASTASSAPNLASITGLAADGDSSNTSPTSGSSSSPASSSSSPPSVSTSSAILTSVATRTSNGPSGPTTITESSTLTTAVATSTRTPNQVAQPPNTTPPSSSSKLPTIVGCAVGIPLGLALAGILTWLIRKRALESKHNKHKHAPSPDPYTTSSTPTEKHSSFAGGAAALGFAGGKKLQRQTHGKTTSEKVGASSPTTPLYMNGDNTATLPPELESQSVGPARPVSTVPGSAELDTGNGFAHNAPVPHAPHLVGLGGGNAHAAPLTPAAPPAVAPAAGGGGRGGRGGRYYAAGGGADSPPPVMAASWGSAPVGYAPPQDHPNAGGGGGGGGGYAPYRPPPGHAAHGGGGGAGAAAAELSGAYPVPVELGQPSPPPAAVAELDEGRR